eukprot:TRINITY_DN2569_c6_g1_i1.p1 TRINITY_DN2569_c6_g1~~TRINITY_DN2569_c6_g1_i1.p1  ORF type:complete len:226 (-),score=56.36 TRINITY_DN2569_c6_g1_i1:206-883(-)
MKIAVLFVLAAGVSATELTNKTWDEQFVEGRSVFVKFMAPWCGHCQALKPTWDLLKEEWKGNKKVLVAHVDCDVQKELCKQHGIENFPTLKWGNNSQNLTLYLDDTGFPGLHRWLKETFGSPQPEIGRCSPENLDSCDSEMKAKIDEFMSMPIEELQAFTQEGKDALAAIDKEMNDGVKKIKKDFVKMRDLREDREKEIKDKLSLMQQCLLQQQRDEGKQKSIGQ